MPGSLVLSKVISTPMALGCLYNWLFCVCSPPHWLFSWAADPVPEAVSELLLLQIFEHSLCCLLWKTSLPFLCKSVSRAGYFYSANVTIIHPGTKMSNPGFLPPFSFSLCSSLLPLSPVMVSIWKACKFHLWTQHCSTLYPLLTLFLATTTR